MMVKKKKKSLGFRVLADQKKFEDVTLGSGKFWWTFLSISYLFYLILSIRKQNKTKKTFFAALLKCWSVEMTLVPKHFAHTYSICPHIYLRSPLSSLTQMLIHWIWSQITCWTPTKCGTKTSHPLMSVEDVNFLVLSCLRLNSVCFHVI